VRVIEYAIESDDQQQVYRLVTDLLDKRDVSSFIVSPGISQTRSVENTLDELKTHLNGRKT
jgi:hypothetical protein